MKRAETESFRTTHSVAAELHRVLVRMNWSARDLARALGESEIFIKGILQGEDSVDRKVNIRLLQRVSDTTRITLTLKILPRSSVARLESVEPTEGQD